MNESGDQPPQGPASSNGRSMSEPPTPLRRQVSRFVGRREEVARITSLLGLHRLLTLTGSPGVGKSRLAYEVVSGAAGTVEYGPFWVDLALVQQPDGVNEATARAFGVQDPDHLFEAVARDAAGRRTLVVLDNAERWIAPCVGLVELLLWSSPHLNLLVTSRERLDVPGETVWQVAPLPSGPARGGGAEPSAPAVELFCLRARAVRPGFELDDETEPVIVEICRRLDGLPLAIELAAGRAAVLSPVQIAAGIGDQSWLLKATSRAASPRHRSMEAAFSWSHDLMTATERALLRRLAVFPGGCTLEAAEGVCADAQLERATVLDVLDQLVSKSLVVAETSGERARYRLLETVRQYAQGHLEQAGEEPELLDRFVGWYMALAESGDQGLAGPYEVAWFERLDAERVNLMAAVECAVSREDPESAVRLAAALALFWRGSRIEEGKLILFNLAGAARQVDPGLRARLLWTLGMLATAEGRFAAAVAPLGDALALAQETGDERTAARALLVLGNCALVLHGPGPALPMVEQSLALARDRDPWCRARATALYAWGVHTSGEAVSALSLAQEAVAAARQAGLVSSLLVCLNILGFVAGRVGESALAKAVLLEALTLADMVDSTAARTHVLTNLADMELAMGRLDEANELLDQAVTASRSSGVPWAVMQPLLSLGKLAEARADPDAAASRFKEVLAVGERIGFASVQAEHGLGRVAARRGGDGASARRALRGVLASAESVGSSTTIADALHDLGELARIAGQHAQAATLHRRALRLRDEVADRAGVAGSLEALAGVSVDQQRFDQAARLFGAAESLRRMIDAAVPPANLARLQADLERAQRALGDRFEPEQSVGAALSAEEAVAAASSRRPSWRPTTGWASLTAAERGVVDLVAAGLTNRQVGERLTISKRTVQTHLSHVFAKLGVRSRTELAARASLQGAIAHQD